MLTSTSLPSPPAIKPIYDYPVLDRVTRDDGVRHYTCPEGHPLPSVTTILDATSDKTSLKLWEERVGAEKAQRARDEGTGLGNIVHAHMEAYVQGLPRPRGSNLIRQMGERMANTIIHKAMPGISEIWGIETALYLPMHYAGTTDLVGVYEGRPAIMDYKNAKKMRKREDIDNYFCQGAAYSLAHNYLFGTDIRSIVIFMVSRDLEFNAYVAEGDEFEHWCSEWVKRLDSYAAGVGAA